MYHKFNAANITEPCATLQYLAADLEKFRVIFFFDIENGILCVLIRIASMRRF